MFYNDNLFVYFHWQKFTINEERGSHANDLLDEFLGERWDLRSQAGCREIFQPCPLGGAVQSENQSRL